MQFESLKWNDGNCFNCINCLMNVNHPEYLTKFNGILIRMEWKSKWILATERINCMFLKWVGGYQRAALEIFHSVDPIIYISDNIHSFFLSNNWTFCIFRRLKNVTSFREFNNRTDYWTSPIPIYNTYPLNMEKFIFLRKLIYETTKNKVNRLNLRGNWDGICKAI